MKHGKTTIASLKETEKELKKIEKKLCLFAITDVMKKICADNNNEIKLTYKERHDECCFDYIENDPYNDYDFVLSVKCKNTNNEFLICMDEDDSNTYHVYCRGSFSDIYSNYFLYNLSYEDSNIVFTRTGTNGLACYWKNIDEFITALNGVLNKDDSYFIYPDYIQDKIDYRKELWDLNCKIEKKFKEKFGKKNWKAGEWYGK